jgi:shikimate kinase
MGRTTRRSNIVLIGMPGSGKSTVGVVLAKQAGLDFVDTDVIIQTLQGRPLQDIVDRDGHLALRRIEEEVLLGLSLRNHVIATGGSAVYSERAMAHLRSEGIPVFLDVDLPTLEGRVRDFGTRGLAKRPGQSFGELYEERLPLYRGHAEITVECGALTHEEVAAGIAEELRARGLLPGMTGRGARGGRSRAGRKPDPEGAALS